MQQTKVSLTPAIIDFLNHHQQYGFRDRSAMVRAALQQLQEELELKELQKSADLYAELYAEDSELVELTEQAVVEWPE
jgi:Arc/MetJ-type ribon-helix-helix transcriptional regulator